MRELGQRSLAEAHIRLGGGQVFQQLARDLALPWRHLALEHVVEIASQNALHGACVLIGCERDSAILVCALEQLGADKLELYGQDTWVIWRQLCKHPVDNVLVPGDASQPRRLDDHRLRLLPGHPGERHHVAKRFFDLSELPQAVEVLLAERQYPAHAQGLVIQAFGQLLAEVGTHLLPLQVEHILELIHQHHQLTVGQ